MPRLLRTPQAELDLLGIWEYIAQDDLDAADRFLERIAQKCLMLADNPQAGRRRPELDEALRSFPVGNYVIFYRPIEDGIDVIRVLNGARDIDSLVWG